MVTREYGAKWVSLGHEVKGAVRPARAKSMQEVMDGVRARLSLHPVEIIGVEGIAAGETLGTREPVLVHSKLEGAGAGLSFTVRSANRTLSDNMLKECIAQFTA